MRGRGPSQTRTKIFRGSREINVSYNVCQVEKKWRGGALLANGVERLTFSPLQAATASPNAFSTRSRDFDALKPRRSCMKAENLRIIGGKTNGREGWRQGGKAGGEEGENNAFFGR